MLPDRAKDFDVLVLTETLWDPGSDVLLPGYNHLSMAKKCKKNINTVVYKVFVSLFVMLILTTYK